MLKKNLRNKTWLTNNIRQFTRKGCQPHGACLMKMPLSTWIPHCCLAHVAQAALGTGHATLLFLSDTPCPGLNKRRDGTPNWILDGCEFQSSTVSVVNHG